MLRRHTALLALPLTCALVAGCAAASGASERTHESHGHRAKVTDRGTGGLKPVTIQSGGHTRTYLLYVPPGDLSSHPLPLVLVFHGAGDTASHTVDETDLPNIADQSHNMILVFPQGYDDSWNEGTGSSPAEQAGVNDVAFVATILRRVERNYAVDMRRVIATGFSNGALLTEYLGCTLSRELTMIAPVEGELPQATSAKCHPPRPLTVFEVHGTADLAIPYSGGAFTGVGGAPGPPVLSAPGSAARWARLDRCSGPAKDKTAGQVMFATYASCADRVTVTLATVNGGKHEWPSGYGPTLANVIAAMPTGRTAVP
ncbi:MAG TPA: PHB depolymerase family esterase [Solirubrobacteraceae bacterium]|jgi:polyhydroxybutyrate depolymerase|nr:PHB depolymerase family esterase [Solirubrobacteraceae bacterium]